MSTTNLNNSRWATSKSSSQTLQPYQNLKPSTSNPNLPSWLIATTTKAGNNKDNDKSNNHSIATNPSNEPSPNSTSIPIPPSTASLTSHTHFLTTLRRLKWKSSFLLISHHRALTNDTNNAIGPHHAFPISSATGRPNAAMLMFKSDFFEFYALLERCLVAALGVFGISVSAEYGGGSGRSAIPIPAVPPPSDSTQLTSSIHANIPTNTLIGDTHTFHNGTHRFHANVLSALDTPSSPLHATLGTGPVRLYLGLAKEFRNRWKQVQDEQDGADDEGEGDEFRGMHERYRRVLEDLRLDEMLVVILSGLEAARRVVRGYLAERSGGVRDVEMGEEGDEVEDVDGVEDVMDWS